MTKCVVEGGILHPCTGMDKVMAPESNSRGKGVTQMDIWNFETHMVTKTFAVLRSGEFTIKGVVMNYCPFCGESIAHHLQTASEVAAQ